MAYTRVLGTIGLIGATVLGAVGPVQASSSVSAVTAARAAQQPNTRLSPTAAKAAALQALRQGFLVTKNGHHIMLSSGLVNAFSSRAAGAHASGATSAGHANVSPGPQPTGGQVTANQDFGFYLTGDGQLFHNTESVAVDPLSATHVVISATDSRLGSDGGILNISSNPVTAGEGGNAGGFGCFVTPTNLVGAFEISPTPCALIQALGGPGVYDSVDGARTFSDLIIPDSLTGAVPNAINTAVLPPAALPVAATSIAGHTATALSGGATAVGCIPPSGAFSPPGLSSMQLPQDCMPYDADGDQSVAFDPAGNLYDVSLGLVTVNPLSNGGFVDAPQTDILLNVSPAVQPVGSLVGSQEFNPPYAAGRVFNNIAPSPTCNPFQSSTALCLHDEVTASTSSSNFLSTAGDASLVGRNWDADGYGHPESAALGGTSTEFECGSSDLVTGAFCLADQPYIAINGVLDPLAYITYTLIDFSDQTSNIFVQTATVPTVFPNVLPFWSSPAEVDNTPNNPYCLPGSNLQFSATADPTTGALVPGPVCDADWGAMPAVGPAPDGTVYIAYESADLDDTANSVVGPGTSGTQSNNALLVAALQGTVNNTTVPVPTAPVLATSFAAEVVDHDLFESSTTPTDPLFTTQNFAQLDPSSGAYFTIPNRPTIAVTGSVTIGPDNYPAGIVVVAWTDQRSLVLNGTTITSLSTSRGTRVWYTLGAIKYGCATVAGCVQTTAIHFDLLGRITGGFGVASSTGFQSPLAIAQPVCNGVPTATVPCGPADVIGTGTGLNAVSIGGVPSYYMAEVNEPNTTVNQFFPAIAAVQNPPAPVSSGIKDNIFIGYYQETPAAPTLNSSGGVATTNATMFYNVAKSNDLGITFGVNPVVTAMPLPTIPNSADYCAIQFGFTFGAAGTTDNPGASAPLFTSAQSAQANCNNVPYFGTYTGAAPDPTANGAYFSWTSTLPDTRNFLVPGSQDVSAVHVN